jgi:hypothetical protein
MGYFLLSKSATTAALDTSEIMLLLFGLILTVGVLGEYRKFPKLLKASHATFELLVVIGIAGELLADGGVFVLSHRLQTISEGELAELNKEAGEARKEAALANLELARLKTPRTLDRNQQRRLLEKVKEFAGTRFDTLPAFDPEAIEISATISDILRSAKWIAVGPSGTVELHGLKIQFAPEYRSELERPAMALTTALNEEGITSTLEVKAEDGIAQGPPSISGLAKNHRAEHNAARVVSVSSSAPN